MKRSLMVLICAAAALPAYRTSFAGIMFESNAIYLKDASPPFPPALPTPIVIADDPLSSPPLDLESRVETNDGVSLEFLPGAFATSKIELTPSGEFSSAVSAEGVFFLGREFYVLAAETTYTEVAAVDGLFNFNIEGPILEIAANGNVSPPEQPRASYFLEVLQNGVSQYMSSAALVGDLSSAVLVDQMGIDLGGDPPVDVGLGWQSEFNDDSGSFDVAVGDVIEYQLRVELATFGFETGGSASVGDPAGIAGFTGSISAGPPQNVIPEPSSLTIWGLGVIGVALATVRRRRSC